MLTIPRTPRIPTVRRIPRTTTTRRVIRRCVSRRSAGEGHAAGGGGPSPPAAGRSTATRDSDSESDDAVGDEAAEPATAGGDTAGPSDPAAAEAEVADGAKPRAKRPPRPKKAAAVELGDDDPELPDRMSEGRVQDPEVGAKAVVPRRPQIGDIRPQPAGRPQIGDTRPAPAAAGGRSGGAAAEPDGGPEAKKKRRRATPKPKKPATTKPTSAGPPPVLDAEAMEKRHGRERNGRPVGRYLMAVQAREGSTQVAVLEGRSLIEHYVSRPADDIGQIHGNIYLGRVQNVLPGMEAAFVDIATPKNAVLYRGDVQYDTEDIVEKADEAADRADAPGPSADPLPGDQEPDRRTRAPGSPRRSRSPAGSSCSSPTRGTYGISKRLPEDERKRLRTILDRVKPVEHGLIVRTAAENVTEHELAADVTRLAETWNEIERKAESARKANQCRLLYREPELAVRVIREEFNAEYRGDRDRRPDAVRGGQVLRRGDEPRARRSGRVLRRAGGRAADLREAPHPRAAAQGARPQGVAAVRRLADHRAHRGVDRDRRQHRQERRHDQPRGDRVPQQPRGGRARSPASCACATSAGSS